VGNVCMKIIGSPADEMWRVDSNIHVNLLAAPMLYILVAVVFAKHCESCFLLRVAMLYTFSQRDSFHRGLLELPLRSCPNSLHRFSRYSTPPPWSVIPERLVLLDFQKVRIS
jgi:hypothetical protein